MKRDDWDDTLPLWVLTRPGLPGGPGWPTEGRSPAGGSPVGPPTQSAALAPPSPLAVGLAAQEASAAKHGPEIAALVPVAVELARKAGPAGVTVSDVRIVGAQRGLVDPLTAGRGRALSWMSAVMQRAGLEPTDRMRRSEIPGSHGRLQRIWMAPDA